jgi:hypothetical protein
MAAIYQSARKKEYLTLSPAPAASGVNMKNSECHKANIVLFGPDKKRAAEPA